MTWYCWYMSQFWAPAAQYLWKNPPPTCLFTKQELLSSCVGLSGGSHRSRSQSRLWTNQATAAWAHMFLQGVRGLISVSSSEWKILFQFRLILCGFLFFQRDRWHLCSKLLPIWKRQRQRDGWGEKTQNGTRWNDFLSWCIAPFLWKKNPKIAPLYHLKCYFFQNLIWNSWPYIIFVAVSHYFHSYGAVEVLSYRKSSQNLWICFFFSSWNLRPPPWDHKSLLVPQFELRVLQNIHLSPQALWLLTANPAHFRHFQAQNWWTWLALYQPW